MILFMDPEQNIRGRDILEMTDEMRKAKAEYVRDYMRNYMKEWRKKNPEKAKEIRLRHWKKRADELHGNKQ